MAYLYKLSLTGADKWSKKPPPVYAVARNKKLVIEYVGSHLKNGISIKSVSCLGEQLGGCMFCGGIRD